MGESPDPPFETRYKELLDTVEAKNLQNLGLAAVEEECELPLIDLSELKHPDKAQSCKELMARASREWGFFQVVNHGVSEEILETMRAEQVKLMKKPFGEKKTNYEGLDIPEGCYQWGTPSPTCLDQISWSESFHVPLNHVLGSAPTNSTLRLQSSRDGGSTSYVYRSSMKQFAEAVREVAHRMADILAEEAIGIGHELQTASSSFIKEICLPGSCYLRLNRYPPCPIQYYLPHHSMFGIIPHTDSDFLTVLHQDATVSGLQLLKDGNWITVKPNATALVINIGDLFQAWSNNVYKSVEHRVVANAQRERFSTAYFLCPSADTVLESDAYRSFTFGEYRKQVREDVEMYGRKIGLPRFLRSQSSHSTT